MAQVLIDFVWWKDGLGYRLVPDRMQRRPEEELVDHPLGIRIVSDRKPQRLMGLGGPLIEYRPLDHFEHLFQIFANTIRSPKDVLGFAQKFGPFTVDGLYEEVGEPVYDTIVHAEGMREFLEFAGGDKRILARGIDAQVAPLGQIDATLALDPLTTRPKLRLSPSSLRDALWLQFGQALSADASLRQCQHCGAWFEAGVGTIRRRDAKFCSNQHRIAFNSLKRSKGE
jgi:hypothetical protein